MISSDKIILEHEYAKKAYGIGVHHHWTREPGCIGALRELFAEFRTKVALENQPPLPGFCREIQPEKRIDTTA